MHKKREHISAVLSRNIQNLSKSIKIYQSNLIGQIILQAPDNAFLQSWDIGLRNPNQICYLLLGVLPSSFFESEAKLHDGALPLL